MLNHKIKEKNIQVVKDFQADLPPVMAFVSELNQVWTNLIDNAIDALPEGGNISIATRQEADLVKVTLTDNGSGIPPEHLNQIFEPFFTTKAMGQGTGLRLDIVNKIMMHHQADIKVNSKPGNTVFELFFPIN